MNRVDALMLLVAPSIAVFSATLSALCEQYDFRVMRISPADAPTLAELSTADRRLALRLQVADDGRFDTSTLVVTKVRHEVVLPNGTRLIPAAQQESESDAEVCQSAVQIARVVDGDDIGQAGRAGMFYRDLIADRLGGRVIASHIRIPTAGNVPDYVHCHNVLAQVIYIVSGSVTVVYEDQGEPFVAHAGSCILQPPMIRHRVLSNSDNLSVLEVTSPATHDTFGDLDLTLPNGRGSALRQWSGQTFVFHDATAPDAVWSAGGWFDIGALKARQTGIGAATRGVIDVVTVRAESPCVVRLNVDETHSLVLLFVLDGELSVGENAPLRAAESISLSKGAYDLRFASTCQFVSVTMSARAELSHQSQQ